MLKEDRYVYMTEGYFPVAKFAFLDEIWNANSAILNAFLMATNEREFRNDGELHKIPLHSMFRASNQLPQSDGLSAIYDRIQFKHEVKPIQEQDAFIEMLKLRWAKPVGTVISWDEIEQAHREAQEVKVPDDILEAVNTIRMQLKQAGIEPTDRKFVDSIGIIQAKAWLEGRDTATIEDLTPLCHVYWTAPGEQSTVESVLLRLANPFDRRATELIAILDSLSNETDLIAAATDMDPFDRNQAAVEIHTATDRVKEDLVKLINDVEKNGRKSVRTEQARAQLRSVTERLMKTMFMLNSQNMDMGIPEAK
jgi:MoxR-like ATPase